MFAHTAKRPGKVASVTDKAITLAYEDGTQEAFELGRVYGTVASLTLPHQLETTLKEGDVFAVGDLIVYNKHYFAVDPLNPKSAVWKAGVLVKVAIMESTDTLEDSSAISERVAQLLATESTTIRNLSVTFGQTVHNLVKVGDTVDLESILCTIEEAETADSGLFDEDALDTLRFLEANTPRAKVKGVVERIEVFYHGDMDDMSESLQGLAMTSDRQRRRMAKELQRNFTSGKVDDAMRVEGNPLMPDHAVIKVYITEEVPAGVGD
jgi:biotin carboxyl carrier protein